MIGDVQVKNKRSVMKYKLSELYGSKVYDNIT